MRIQKCAYILLMILTSKGISEGYFGFNGGLFWPSALRTVEGSGSQTAWHAGFEWGGVSQERIALGGSFRVMWKRVADDSLADTTSDQAGGVIEEYTINRSITRVMFPVEGNVLIDPAPMLPVRPVFHAAAGPAMMLYLNRQAQEDLGPHERELTASSGVYWGLIGRIGADLMIALGDDSGIFFGAEYQWSRLIKNKWGTNTRYRQDMSGPAVRIGIRIL